MSWLESIGYVPGRSGKAPLHIGMWLMNSEPSHMHTRALVLQRCIVVDSDEPAAFGYGVHADD